MSAINEKHSKMLEIVTATWEQLEFTQFHTMSLEAFFTGFEGSCKQVVGTVYRSRTFLCAGCLSRFASPSEFAQDDDVRNSMMEWIHEQSYIDRTSCTNSMYSI